MKASAFAPATIGNVSIGFDILGLAIAGAGDTVHVTKISEPLVKLIKISGTDSPLPLSARLNTAGAAVIALRKLAKVKFGFEIELEKGIPMGSGMGGSAASAVAAVVAANLLLPKPLSLAQLMECALVGEKMASGGMHPDNVAPCIYGGLTFASLRLKPAVTSLPFSSDIYWLLIHPDLQVETKKARRILKKQIPLTAYVDQSARLTAFVAGLFLKDMGLIRQGFQDEIIENQRQHLIPGFKKIKSISKNVPGVLGLSISGSGPSLFALTSSRASAQNLGRLAQNEFSKLGIESQFYSGKGPAPGARGWLADGSRR